MAGKGLRNGRGGKQGQHGFVTEALRIRVGKVLEDFRASDGEVYTFELGLSKEERATIHQMCQKLGMISRSSGKGASRCLSVYKRKKKQRHDGREDESITCLNFTEKSKNVLQDLFARYPPDDGELSKDALDGRSETVGKVHWTGDSCFCKPSMRMDEIVKKMEMLALRMSNDKILRKTAEDRAKLPIASYKNVITSSLEDNQVPQYILDHMWSKGEACKIVCTQPRRISAISVAERISYERGEIVGDTIGYKIRLETKGGRHSSIMFCTNGILLRILISRGSNGPRIVSKRRSAKDALLEITHVIVILMSATMDADRFLQYFGGCPIIQIPGFTYPVNAFYLEDVLSIVRLTDRNHLNTGSLSCVEDAAPLTEEYKAELDESINLAINNDELELLLEIISSSEKDEIFCYQHSVTGVSPLMVFAGKGRVGEVCMMLSNGVNCSLTDKDGKSALDWAQQENELQIYEILKSHMEKDITKLAEKEELLNEYLAVINPENIDIILIERLLKKICIDSSEGAILVFLPGWDDISQTQERLLASRVFGDSSKFMILPLHSMIPTTEQKRVFKRPPDGVRKIILSTNIAETAVTIDDVVYVVDSGRMKEKGYDPYSNVSTLHSSWISKASARQREGRAGRCQPGTCYHLFSKKRAASLPDYQVPEIKRMPIDELCLQVKLLNPNCRIIDFLQKTLDPPVSETIQNAIIVLQDIGALTEDEQLTELGEKLGALPVHPSTSRMLLFAVLMNCLEPALTLACAADYREPFILPMAPDEKKKASLAKVELASLYGGYSDQLAIVAAFECWKRAKDRGQELHFCSRYFVSSSTMHMLFNMRKQLQNELVKAGFIPHDLSHCNLNAEDPGILRSVVVAGSYPMVGRLLPREQNKKTMLEAASGCKVRLHPHSLNFNLLFQISAGSPIAVYDEITRGDGGLYIKKCSVASAYPLLLLALEMAVAPANDSDDDSTDDLEALGDEENEMNMKSSSQKCGNQMMSSPDNVVTVIVDRWLKFQSTALDVAQIYCLRERLAAAILFKVKRPNAVLPPALGASMYAIACILSYQELSNVLALNESINPSAQGTKVGQVTLSDFLKSLLSASRKPPNNFHEFPERQPPITAPASLSVCAPLCRIEHQKPFNGPSTGSPSNLKKVSFKRRRGSTGGRH
ncbi:putative pre-mRNA-splicing factor ATP-dependent RNA helicase [Apostasia shenzhenica]|uniref:Putative pre-mRNA-splicing factor ATP-dependent RNA helicase n=1 Tax=Apostasia shenzhenica TaxID=1088818 RepID=A0A2I0A3N1_9ASPA|nr:putative pre-mRNA-splicing factor ATP-dependent RNA helicase [Apostasia shenzhenica]